MKREERIREARRRAAESAPQREREARAKAQRLHDLVSRVGPEEAQRQVAEAGSSSDTEYLGPVKTPREWGAAVGIARDVAIQAALRRRTITYGEIQYAVYQSLGKLVGWSMFAELVASVNQASDGVLLSAIIVHKDDGKPGDGFLPYARSKGFEEPLATLQRRVFERFAGQG